MTDEPTPEEWARYFTDVAADLAVARRLLASLHARDVDAVQSLIYEVIDSGRGSQTLFATALAALELAHQIEPDRDRLQKQLDELAMGGIDTAEELAAMWRDPE